MMQESWNGRHGRWMPRLTSGKFALLSLAYVLAGPASSVLADEVQLAQTATPASAMSVTEIRACLCMEQAMATDRDDLDLRQDLLNERQQELANVDQQVQEQRANLSPTDTVGQQVLKDLLGQQQSLRTLVQTDLRPAYNSKVSDLNALVANYNAQCVNRQRYAADEKTAQQDLQCPKP
jgi:hypothetical protein